jgi:hypothetical protein
MTVAVTLMILTLNCRTSNSLFLDSRRMYILDRAVQIMEDNVERRMQLQHGKFISAFGALSHVALHRRGTARASDCPSVCYVEGEPAFGTSHRLFGLRTHRGSLSLNQGSDRILKTFPGVLALFDAEPLVTFKTTKRYTSEAYRICSWRKASLGTKC